MYIYIYTYIYIYIYIYSEEWATSQDLDPRPPLLNST